MTRLATKFGPTIRWMAAGRRVISASIAFGIRRCRAATAASPDAGRARVERAVFRHGVGVDAELFGDGIGAQSFAQLLGDLLLHCRGERGTADALALRSGSGHARARPLADLLRLHFGQ